MLCLKLRQIVNVFIDNDQEIFCSLVGGDLVLGEHLRHDQRSRLNETIALVSPQSEGLLRQEGSLWCYGLIAKLGISWLWEKCSKDESVTCTISLIPRLPHAY